MSMIEMYVLIKLDAIVLCAKGLGWVLASVGILLWSFAWATLNKEFSQDYRNKRPIFLKYGIISSVLAAVFFISSMLIPTTREMCAIIVVPKVLTAADKIMDCAMQDETMKKIPKEIVITANEWVKALRPEDLKGGALEFIKELKK